MKDYIIDTDNISLNCEECTICTCKDGHICDNCSNCLGLSGYEARGIKIDEVIDKNDNNDLNFDLGDFSDFDVFDEDEIPLGDDENIIESEDLPYVDALEEGNWEYLEDIEDINELINSSDSSDILTEHFPGLYIINKKQ